MVGGFIPFNGTLISDMIVKTYTSIQLIHQATVTGSDPEQLNIDHYDYALQNILGVESGFFGKDSNNVQNIPVYSYDDSGSPILFKAQFSALNTFEKIFQLLRLFQLVSKSVIEDNRLIEHYLETKEAYTDVMRLAVAGTSPEKFEYTDTYLTARFDIIAGYPTGTAGADVYKNMFQNYIYMLFGIDINSDTYSWIEYTYNDSGATDYFEIRAQANDLTRRNAIFKFFEHLTPGAGIVNEYELLYDIFDDILGW